MRAGDGWFGPSSQCWQRLRFLAIASAHYSPVKATPLEFVALVGPNHDVGLKLDRGEDDTGMTAHQWGRRIVHVTDGGVEALVGWSPDARRIDLSKAKGLPKVNVHVFSYFLRTTNGVIGRLTSGVASPRVYLPVQSFLFLYKDIGTIVSLPTYFAEGTSRDIGECLGGWSDRRKKGETCPC